MPTKTLLDKFFSRFHGHSRYFFPVFFSPKTKNSLGQKKLFFPGNQIHCFSQKSLNEENMWPWVLFFLLATVVFCLKRTGKKKASFDFLLVNKFFFCKQNEAEKEKQNRNFFVSFFWVFNKGMEFEVEDELAGPLTKQQALQQGESRI
jgi:hypothetical protein